MHIEQRLTSLREMMEHKGISVSVIFNPDHQFYLSGFKALLYSRPIVMLIDEEKTRLIVPGLEEIHAREEALVDEVQVYYEHPEMAEKGTNYKEIIKNILSKYPDGSKIGIDTSFAPTDVTVYFKDLGYKIVDIGRNIVEMRYVKDQKEIKLMEEAGRLVNLAVSETLKSCCPGMTEIEIDSRGNAALFSETAKTHPNATLDLVVMSPSGIERSVMPHVFSNTRTLQRGDVVIHSRQVGLNGYRAELERTFFIGEPSEKQKKAFEAARLAQEVALDFIKPGVTAAEVDNVARQVIEKEGYSEYFIHRVGHGIGVSAHEEPYLRFDNNLVLEEGMAFSIEPGIYIPGVGGFRHSDTVVLTSNGHKCITDYPRDLNSLIFE